MKRKSTIFLIVMLLLIFQSVIFMHLKMIHEMMLF